MLTRTCHDPGPPACEHAACALARIATPARTHVLSPRSSSAKLVGLLGHLRLAVGRHVCDRRQAGAPIERVLPEVKGLVREAAAREGCHDPADALMQQVVGWTITAFYDALVPRHPSRESRESQEAPHVSGRR